MERYDFSETPEYMLATGFRCGFLCEVSVLRYSVFHTD